MTDEVSPIGTILNLQRLSTEDGPGLRTTVFFKGCPLDCAWCHNPESISAAIEIHWLENRCIGCGTCLQSCHIHALKRTEDGLQIDRNACDLCGDCSRACPANALEVLGKTSDIPSLVSELEKDRSYYERSGGGITLSGGEPTLQPTFALQTAAILHEKGYHVALDTCGLASRMTLEKLLPHVDLVLYDIKIMDSSEHLRWTGQDNRIILENLRWLIQWKDEHAGKPDLWIRTPLIPGATDSEMNLVMIANFLNNEFVESIQRWEICAFNNLCRDKYRRLDIIWAFEKSTTYQAEQLDSLMGIVRATGFPSDKVQITGTNRVEGLQ
jgi:pyruvate formate lyase activating enzyme